MAIGLIAATASSSLGGTAARSKFTGPPIKVMTVAPVNSNTLSYPNFLVTAKIAGQWINAHGGVKDASGLTHRLQVETCDDRNDPNQVAACGRLAVAHKDVALVGSYTSNGNRIIPILQAGKTAWFGICCANASLENTSRVSFPTAGSPAYFAATAYYAAKTCNKPALAVIDVPFKGYITGLTTAGFKAGGKSAPNAVFVPPVTQDYSPQVAQATAGNPDCLVAILSEGQWFAILPAIAQSGWKGTLIGIQGNLDDANVPKVPHSVTEGAVDIGAYPDLSSPVFADYRAAVKLFKANPKLTYNAIGSLGTWSGYKAFADIVSHMRGPINNRTFLAAANRATAVRTGGQTPVLNFAEEYDSKGLNRIFNRHVTLSAVRDGKFYPLTNKFYDMTEVIKGKPGPAMPPRPPHS